MTSPDKNLGVFAMRITGSLTVCCLTCLLTVLNVQADETSSPMKKALAELDYMVGTWRSELTMNGETIGVAEHKREWSPGKHCLLITSTSERDGVKTQAAAISGWNAKGKAIVEHWHASNGISLVVCYPLAKMTADAWVGTHRFIDADGKESKGSCRLEKKGKDDWVYTAIIESDGETNTIKNITRRVKK